MRDKTVKALQQYLKRAHDIEELELSKMWYALFYCYWHSDKRPVQADLAERLGCLIHSLPPHKTWLWARVFWDTMARQWTTIDRLRLDKFYNLMRRVLHHNLLRLQRDSWAEGATAECAGMLRTSMLDRAVPIGIRYFIADEFVGALKAARPSGPAAGAARTLGRGTTRALLASREDVA